MENKTQIIPQTEHIQNPIEKWWKENKLISKKLKNEQIAVTHL
jgi:hypothetical protein